MPATGTRPSTYQPRKEECGFFQLWDGVKYAEKAGFDVRELSGSIEATRRDMPDRIYRLQKDRIDKKLYWISTTEGD